MQRKKTAKLFEVFGVPTRHGNVRQRRGDSHLSGVRVCIKKNEEQKRGNEGQRGVFRIRVKVRREKERHADGDEYRGDAHVSDGARERRRIYVRRGVIILARGVKPEGVFVEQLHKGDKREDKRRRL